MVNRLKYSLWCLALLALSAQPGPVNAQDLAGRASVIDGDTLEVQGQRVRLHGIDAPESGQTCKRPSGEVWRCGQRAAFALADRIGSQAVTCSARDRDRYGRIVAVCGAGGDLNAFMVRNGWAVAYRRYSSDYLAAEREAQAAGAGIWSSQFVMPWDWRRGARLDAAAAGDCPIKGNISRSGERIYHVPGGQYYQRTRFDPSKGERCFQSEADARSVGWRRSKR